MKKHSLPSTLKRIWDDPLPNLWADKLGRLLWQEARSLFVIGPGMLVFTALGGSHVIAWIITDALGGREPDHGLLNIAMVWMGLITLGVGLGLVSTIHWVLRVCLWTAVTLLPLIIVMYGYTIAEMFKENIFGVKYVLILGMGFYPTAILVALEGGGGYYGGGRWRRW